MTDKPAFTPGPWTFDHDWHRLPTIFAPGGKTIIAIIDQSNPNAQGDAMMATAAPDMYAALEAMLEGRPIKAPPKEAAVAYRNWELFERARAALRKARGEQ